MISLLNATDIELDSVSGQNITAILLQLKDKNFANNLSQCYHKASESWDN